MLFRIITASSSSISISRSRRTTTLIKGGIGGSLLAIASLEVTTHYSPSEKLRSSKFYHYVADDIVTPLMRKILNPEDAHEIAIHLLSSSNTYSRWLIPKFRPSAIEQRYDMSMTIDFDQNNKSNKNNNNNNNNNNKRNNSNSNNNNNNKVKIKRLKFPNVIGMAAGFDKDGIAIEGLINNIGFGFVEIGSVCLYPQPGNPSPRMFRLVDDEAIINRYGFNSLGCDVVEQHLKEYHRRQKQKQQPNSSNNQPLLGINLGLNKTSKTPKEDYQQLIRRLGQYADYLVVNVSSPNTPGLRDLQFTLNELLTACLEARNQLTTTTTTSSSSSSSTEVEAEGLLPPLFVKLAPDLTNEQLTMIAKVLIDVGIDGVIITNTTIQRPNTLRETNTKLRNEIGGLSGKPLKQTSTEIIRTMYKLTDGKIPIIGVGGIFTGDDVIEKLKAGATCVEIYTGMIYQGPGTVTKIRHDVAQIFENMEQKKHHRSIKKLQDIVGIDHHR